MPFDTSIRDQAVREERSRRERVRLRVLSASQSALKDLAPTFGVKEAYFFGSVCRPGAYHEDSDVDLAIGGERIDPLGLAAKLSRTVGREVHVVELDGSRIAQRAIREGVRWIRES